MKDIPNFEGLYAITKDGKVWSYVSHKFLSLKTDKFSYKRVTLYKNKRKYDKRVHRLMAETYIPNPNNYPTVDHINRNPSDNRIENLRWATYLQQAKNRDNKVCFNSIKAMSDVNSKPVECRDKENHDILIQTYKSSYRAAIELFNDASKNSLINRCANGKRQSAYGYYWKFSND